MVSRHFGFLSSRACPWALVRRYVLIMLTTNLESLRKAKSRFECQKRHDSTLVCRVGMHMDCAVLKLQKPAWTNDDLSKMGNALPSSRLCASA